MSVVEYVKELYKPDVREFTTFLEENEKYSKELDNYLNNPTLADEIKEIIYYGSIYKLFYANPIMRPSFVEIERDKKRDSVKYVVNYDSLVTWLIKRFCIITFKQINYIYKNNKFGENEGEIEKECERVLKKDGLADKKKIREIVREVGFRINIRTFFREFPFNKLGRTFIPLKNGVLLRGTDSFLLPHSLAFGYTYCLPVTYNPNAKCPNIDKFISEVVVDQDQKILYEIPASCLLQSTEYHHAYMLVGEGSNGKSTYLKILEKVLGESNVSNVSLQDITNNRFAAASLVGKLANIYADIPKQFLRDTGRFKVITGGDRLVVERKFKDGFEVRLPVRFIFSANVLPEVTDETHAFWRRWILIKFPNKFPQNPDLLDELTTEEELSGFFNKILEALTRIELTGKVTITETVEKQKEEWMRMANPVYAFVRDCLEFEPGGYELKDDVYNAYRDYCKLNNLRIVAKNTFGMELQRQDARIKATKRMIGGKQTHVWAGILLKCVGEAEEKEEEKKTLDGFEESEEPKIEDIEFNLEDIYG